jgi:hypothetical protein
MKKNKGEIVTVLILAIALVGTTVFGVSYIKHSSKSEANRIENVTTQTANNNTEIGQKVAAGVTAIQTANNMAPDSPSKTFIQRESGYLLPLLPPPDYKSLFEAEKRRVSVMEGKIEEANKLYGKAEEKNTKLLEEKAQLKAELDKVKQDLFFEAGQSSMFKIISASTVVLLLIVGSIAFYLRSHNLSLYAGLQEFTTYCKDDKTLAELREAFDSNIKKKLGL